MRFARDPLPANVYQRFYPITYLQVEPGTFQYYYRQDGSRGGDERWPISELGEMILQYFQIANLSTEEGTDLRCM